MNIVLIVPTGIGAEIGGHAGDANPVAKLIGACCDNIITHPNVVNASDINEMPENTWYVEGSMLDRFLEGEITLRKKPYNKILVALNKPIKNEIINSVNAARATIGADIRIVALDTPLKMTGWVEKGIAGGDISGHQELISQIKNIDFDVLAISSPITVDRQTKLTYFRTGGVNPWGGVEAMVSKIISVGLNKPVAHAPTEETDRDDKEIYCFQENEVVDPRIAAEVVSVSYIHCVLKGLHTAPIIGKGLSHEDIDMMISPSQCWGRPHAACKKAGIPIISVRENRVTSSVLCPPPSDMIEVENYWDAAGLIMAMKAGIDPWSVRRPLRKAKIL